MTGIGNEAAIIGAILIDDSAIEKIDKIISSNDFTGRNAKIYKAIESLVVQQVIPDLVSVSSELTKTDELRSVGGSVYLAEIVEQTISSANVGFFAKKVREDSVRRKIKSFASEIMAHDGTVDELITLVEEKAFSFDNQKDNAPVHILQGVKKALKSLEVAYNNKGTLLGLTTGLNGLDSMLHGLQPGKVYLIAGRPGMGKSGLGVNIAQANKDITSLIITMEMEAEEIAQRAMSASGKFDASTVYSGQVREADWPRITMAAGDVNSSKIWIDDASTRNMSQIYATARKFKRQHNLGLLVVDYLQLVDGSGTEYEIVGNASKMFKRIAKDLKIPVIVLSQLNRSLENRDDKRPRLSDLRGTGQIEQDADVIIFPYREAVYCDCKGVMHCEKNHQDKAEIIIAKHRGGKIGMVKAKFIGKHTLFTNPPEEKHYG